MKLNLKKKLKSIVLVSLIATLGLTGLTGCGANDQVVIYSNADDEAVAAISKTLDDNGYKGKYLIQSFGTSELGGKILAEGKDIEADMITMSSFYIESAQKEHTMFQDLTFDVKTFEKYPSYYAPFIAQQGTILLNTKVLADNNLPTPTSVKDLANPVYAGMLSVVDIQGSSTAWLMVQSLIEEYGENQAKEILTGIYKNAGAHLEQSGSGPIKKVRAGEVAIGFGLRHQAVADKNEGLPIDFVDPIEGNFSLTESIAVVDKGNKTKTLAMDMAQCIIENGRSLLTESYPMPLYGGETANATALSTNSKKFSKALTIELLEEHKQLSQSCK